MLKVLSAAGLMFVLGVWAICAFFWLSPMERSGSHQTADVARVAEPVSRTRDGGNVTAPKATLPSAAPVSVAPVTTTTQTAPAPAEPAQSPAPPTAQPAYVPSQATAPSVEDPNKPPVAKQPAKPAPQYTALGGYVFDGDSVVVAPTNPDSPGSAAEQRRRVRLSTDISKIP